MTQDVLKEKLARFLEITRPKETKNLSDDLRRHGFCHGLSVCHASMHLIDKLDWWEAALNAIMNWNGNASHLKKKIKLPKSDSQHQTLEDIINRVIHYIVFNHVETFDKSYQTIYLKNIAQHNLLDPKTKFFEILTPTKTLKKI